MIRLALLIPTLDRSGAEKQFTLLATRLPRDEFDVHAIALTRGGPFARDLAEHGISVTVIGKRLKADPLALWKLRRLLAALDPDLLHTWMFTANAYGRMAVGRPPRMRVVSAERCVDVWKAGWQLRTDRWLMPRTDRFVVNSEAVAEFCRSAGYPAERLAVIRNGVELPGGGSHLRERLLSEIGVPRGAKLVGYAGRLARQKRVHDLVWAMQLLRQIHENVWFLVIGDGPERRSLEGLARHFGCDHLVRFLGHRPDAADLIGLLNCFWLASDFEGMSNSLMEAMAAGVPVVATDIPPNRELVSAGESGFLVKVGDSVGFAQFTDRILADRDLAARLGTAGREHARTEFGIERMVQDHIALYRDVLAAEPAGLRRARADS